MYIPLMYTTIFGERSIALVLNYHLKLNQTHAVDQFFKNIQQRTIGDPVQIYFLYQMDICLFTIQVKTKPEKQ